MQRWRYASEIVSYDLGCADMRVSQGTREA